jgi:L-asparaginase II
MLFGRHVVAKIRGSMSGKPTDPIAEPLVEVKRGSITESRHRGHIVAVEPDGNIVARSGSENVTFLRSSAKPFQALPLLVSGAADTIWLH